MTMLMLPLTWQQYDDCVNGMLELVAYQDEYVHHIPQNLDKVYVEEVSDGWPTGRHTTAIVARVTKGPKYFTFTIFAEKENEKDERKI